MHNTIPQYIGIVPSLGQTVRKVSVPRVSVSPVGRCGGLGFDSDPAPALLVN